jgi:hypothetical protein
MNNEINERLTHGLQVLEKRVDRKAAFGYRRAVEKG